MEDSSFSRLNVGPKPACSNVPCRVVVILICTILILAGFVFFVLGCLYTWSQSTAYNYVRVIIDNYRKFTELEKNDIILPTLLDSLLEYTEPVGLIAFWDGILIMSLCALGLSGAIQRSRFLLFLFASTLFAKILVTSVILVAFHANPKPVVATYKDMLKNSVTQYVGLNSVDKHSLFLNIVMPYLHCCGVEGGEDFSGSTYFDKKYIDPDGMRILLSYPYSCCNMREPYVTTAGQCPKTFNEQNSRLKNGCWEQMESMVLNIYVKVSYMAIVITLLELALACGAMYVTLAIEEDRTIQL